MMVYLRTAVLALVLATLAFCADLTGNWKGTMKRSGGDDLDTSFVFKVAGEKLTGTVTNMYGEEQITEGSVKGDDVSFIVVAGGGQFKLVYKGKVVDGKLIFKVTVGDFGDADLTATRS